MVHHYWVKISANEEPPRWLDLATGEIRRGYADPFSRVARPPLARGWAEGLELTEQERKRVVRASVCYTRIVEEEK